MLGEVSASVGGGGTGGGVPGHGSVMGTPTIMVASAVGAGGRGGGVAMLRGVGGGVAVPLGVGGLGGVAAPLLLPSKPGDCFDEEVLECEEDENFPPLLLLLKLLLEVFFCDDALDFSLRRSSLSGFLLAII